MTLVLLAASSAIGQERRWNYGVIPSVHISTFAGEKADSNSSGASVGLAAFAESNSDWGWLGLALGYAQNRSMLAASGHTNLYHAVQLSFDWSKALDGQNKTNLHAGIIPSGLLMHSRKILDGSKSGGISVQNLALPYSFDLGMKIGLGFAVAQGIELEINYQDHVLNNLSRSSPDPFGDFVQLALRIKLNGVEWKQHDYSAAKQALEEISRGTLVFVLSGNDSLGKTANSTPLYISLQEQMELVDSFYHFSDFAFLSDTQLSAFLDLRDLSLLINDGSHEHSEPYYVVRVGQHFLSENDVVKSGLFLYDQGMDPVPEPLPFYVPYRYMSHHFDDVQAWKLMLSEFNAALYRAAKGLKLSENPNTP